MNRRNFIGMLPLLIAPPVKAQFSIPCNLISAPNLQPGNCAIKSGITWHDGADYWYDYVLGQGAGGSPPVNTPGRKLQTISLPTQLASGFLTIAQNNIIALGASGDNNTFVAGSDGSMVNIGEFVSNTSLNPTNGYRNANVIGSNVNFATINPIGIGIVTSLLAWSPNYFKARVTGQADVAAATVSYGGAAIIQITQCGDGVISGNDLNADASKIAIFYGAQNDTTFAAAYAKALLA